ncbi:MAG TPA: ATP-binding protein, partial [Nitrospirae bacterium]|nr:archaeal ATPase [bacterium BMS3Bbin08]HDO25994.1 ATP-binding protein [Nitrospirota bacterium]
MIYERKILKHIENYMDTSDVIVIHGARQVGKTTLMTSLMDRLTGSGEPPNNVVYFDLEDFDLLALCNSGQDAVVEHLKGIGCDFRKIIYLFIDEIQYLENPSSFLKLFHDRYKGKVKLVVSGSSSFAIKSKFKESLVGRTIDFELFGLDFEELLVFKEKRFDMSARPSEKIEKELRRLYVEYILYGGYPRIVLEESVKRKETFLKQILSTYIKKDIRDFLNIRDTGKFSNFLRMLAGQSSGLCNSNELSNTLKMSRKTIDEHLFLLENTYVIRRLYPFHRNIRSELSKMPKIFIEDTGIMNLLINGTFSTTVTGKLFETSIYSCLRKNINIETLYYWRTNKGQEIDFIVTEGKRLIPIEVKSKFVHSGMSGLRYFLNAYPASKGLCVTLDHGIKWDNEQVKIVYPWRLLPYISE